MTASREDLQFLVEPQTEQRRTQLSTGHSTKFRACGKARLSFQRLWLLRYQHCEHEGKKGWNWWAETHSGNLLQDEKWTHENSIFYLAAAVLGHTDSTSVLTLNSKVVFSWCKDEMIAIWDYTWFWKAPHLEARWVSDLRATELREVF